MSGFREIGLKRSVKTAEVRCLLIIVPSYILTVTKKKRMGKFNYIIGCEPYLSPPPLPHSLQGKASQGPSAPTFGRPLQLCWLATNGTQEPVAFPLRGEGSKLPCKPSTVCYTCWNFYSVRRNFYSARRILIHMHCLTDVLRNYDVFLSSPPSL